MYFGNSNGLMSFDGYHWTMIDPVLAISMIKGTDHLIYVGARGDFGLKLLSCLSSASGGR